MHIAIESHVVAVAARKESADVDTRVIAERRRPMWVARALLVVAGAAVLWCVVVAATVQEVTAENCVARGCVVQSRVVFIAFAIKEMLAVRRCVVATAYSTMIARSDWRLCLTKFCITETRLSQRGLQ